MNPMQLLGMLRGGANPQQEELLADLIATYGQEIANITNCLNNRIRGTS